MSDLADSTEKLELLLKLIMHESDPARYDELAAEIWRVLEERQRLKPAATEPIHSSP